MKTVAPPHADPMGETELETVELQGKAGLFAMLALFGMTLRSLCRLRRLSVLVLLCVLPIGLAILIRALAGEEFNSMRNYGNYFRLETMIAFYFMPHVLLPLTALVFGASVIQDEIEDQTLTYLLVRPLPRWGLYTVKLLAAMLVAGLLLTVFGAATQAAIWYGSGALDAKDWLKRTGDYLLAMLCALPAYCTVFGFISLIFRRSLIVGACYILAFEWLLSNIPFIVREYTVMYYLRVLWLRWLTIPDDFNFATNLRRTWGFNLDTVPTANAAVTTLAVVAGMFLCLGCYLMATREFRVKTPEGS
jgi:ABC-2 type transport system permease protein